MVFAGAQPTCPADGLSSRRSLGAARTEDGESYPVGIVQPIEEAISLQVWQRG